MKNEKLCDVLNNLSKDCHERSFNAGWWKHPKTGESFFDSDYLDYVVATKISLIHSETTEALEGYRRSEMDSHLPHRTALETELADILVRVFDLAGALGLDIGGAYSEKLEYNSKRSDHKIENRVKKGGKKF